MLCKMHRHIFDREIGGTSIRANRGHNYQWKMPRPSSEVLLDRFETAHHDQIFMTRYTEGLPMACQFGRASNSYLCAVTDEDGLVQIFDTRPTVMARDAARVKCWQAHNNAAFDFVWINGDSQCLTSSGDQTVALWDVENTTRVTTFRGHNCSVRTVAPCPGSPAQCASGARDGHIMLWDSRVNKKSEDSNGPVKSIKYAHSLASRSEIRKHRRNTRHAGPKGVMDTQQSVTCVLYQTDNILISSGAMDGCVKFWDTRKWYTNSATSLPVPVHTFEYPGQMHRLKGIVTMCVNQWKSQLFVSYTDNKVYRFDIAGVHQKAAEYVYAGHRNDTFYVRCALSPDGNYLLSGSGKNTGVIWQVDKPQNQPVFLIGHTQDVSAVDWCPTDIGTLATLSDDMSLRIWRPAPREPDTEDPSILGFAFSARPGKQCVRQAQVHIIQDEFPFRVSEDRSQSTEQHDPTPGARAAEEVAYAAHPSNQLMAVQVPERFRPNGKRVFQASCSTPKCSPERPRPHTPPVTSTSCQVLKLSKEQVTPPPRLMGKGSGNESDTENGFIAQRQLTPRRMQFLSPLPERTEGSTASSPCTPLNNAVPSPFSSYRILSGTRSYLLSLDSDCDSETPLAQRLCLRAIDTNSPSKNSGASTPLSSPRKSPLKSPKKSPHKKVFQTRILTFSSPTANLPNSVLDPPQRKSPAPPSDAEKKVDWLTSYRLSKAETPATSTEGTMPKISPSGGASRNLFPSDTRSTSENCSGKSSTPKRKSSTLPAVESNDATPRKRSKTGRPETPETSGKGTGFAKARTSSSAPKRKGFSSGSPKTPTNMSIRRYFQFQ